jgi:acyl-CoA reductase-like NAD-dependent aldehyde dehydrogenase
MKLINFKPGQEPVDLPLLIENEWRPARSEKRINVNNPATGELVGYAASAEREEAIAALEAANRAFPDWARTSGDERAALLKKAGESVLARQEDLAKLLTLEQGKPLRDARGEVGSAAKTLIYYGEEARRIRGEIAPSKSQNTRSLVIRQPIGVVVAIVPWNYPMSLTAWKIGPALAAGCTVVVRPTSETPLAAALFSAICAEVGAPPGVVNVVTGASSKIGDELVANPLSQMIAFTGSTEVGRHLMEIAAPNLKKCMLELGGHAALVVCKDANLEQAVKDGVKRSFRNAGQICNSVNRIFVHKSLYDAYVQSFAEQAKWQTIGDGLANPNVDIGPMVNQEGIDRTQRFVDDALARGARLLCGGKRCEAPELSKGFFYEPTALVDVTEQMMLMAEEPFGPIVGIAPFEDVDHALDLVNSTDYGLVNYVYSNDLSTIIRLYEGIDTGTVGVNSVGPDSLYAPYPAWKQSGLGVELSYHGLDEYLKYKHVLLAFGH